MRRKQFAARTDLDVERGIAKVFSAAFPVPNRSSKRIAPAESILRARQVAVRQRAPDSGGRNRHAVRAANRVDRRDGKAEPAPNHPQRLDIAGAAASKAVIVSDVQRAEREAVD